MTLDQMTAPHQCRDCKTMVLAPKVMLCARCRAAAEEKRKARKREKTCERYRAKRQLMRAAIPESPRLGPPHLCATEGCRSIIEGRALYCASCRRARQLQRRRNYRNNVAPPEEDMPPEPPTSLVWLDNFHDWATSGLSYADYQKRKIFGK